MKVDEPLFANEVILTGPFLDSHVSCMFNFFREPDRHGLGRTNNLDFYSIAVADELLWAETWHLCAKPRDPE